MIKNIARKIIPIKYIDRLRLSFNVLNVLSYIVYDYSHLIYFWKKEEVKITDIIRQYHRLEKAMSKVPYDTSRGSRAAETLIILLERYHKFSHVLDVQFYVALNVLEGFLKKSDKYKSPIFLRLKSLKIERKDIKTGVENTPVSYFLDNAQANFARLAESRKSIRYFSDQKVDIEKVEEALDIAKKTPSVCNRQGWHTWVITDELILEEFKKIHNGFSLSNQNLKTLLVMTFNKDAFDYPMERNQGFTDVGLYSMSVMYALTSLGLASCPLNSNLYLKDKRKFKKVVGIPNNFTLGMFIAVGNYLENNPSPVSYRYPVQDKYTLK